MNTFHVLLQSPKSTVGLVAQCTFVLFHRLWGMYYVDMPSEPFIVFGNHITQGAFILQVCSASILRALMLHFSRVNLGFRSFRYDCPTAFVLRLSGPNTVVYSLGFL